MQKQCPVCRQMFECRNDDILECQCIHVKLTPEARAYIAEHFNDCLCVKCLEHINEQSKNNFRPSKPGHDRFVP